MALLSSAQSERRRPKTSLRKAKKATTREPPKAKEGEREARNNCIDIKRQRYDFTTNDRHTLINVIKRFPLGVKEHAFSLHTSHVTCSSLHSFIRSVSSFMKENH